MSGTEIAHGGTRGAIVGMGDKQQKGMLLRVCSAMSGTDLVYGANPELWTYGVLCDVRYSHHGMVLPGAELGKGYCPPPLSPRPLNAPVKFRYSHSEWYYTSGMRRPVLTLRTVLPIQ
eukprot:753267-Rhodomonas_salina.3